MSGKTSGPVPPKQGYVYMIRWNERRGEPGELGREPLRRYALSTHPAHTPKEVNEFFQVHGVGQGYNVYVQCITPPARRLTPAARGQRRVKNLERRIAKTTGPLFADEVRAQAISERPQYFAGEEVDPRYGEFIRESDAADARDWEAFLKWYAEQSVPLDRVD